MGSFLETNLMLQDPWKKVVVLVSTFHRDAEQTEVSSSTSTNAQTKYHLSVR